MPTRAQVSAWIAACGLIVPAFAAAQDRTERELVDLIVREGPMAKAIRAQAEVTRAEQLARLAYPNPSVLYSRETAGFTEFLQAEQVLPVFGTRAALSRAGVAATEAAEAEGDARLWRLRSEATAGVARWIAERARLDVSERHVRDVERLIEVLRVREREGEGSRFDRLRAEQELRETRQLVIAAGIAVAAARSHLTAMLPRGVTATGIVGTLQVPQAPASVETLVARAAETRAELRALQRTRDRADFESQAAWRARLPAPSVFGGLKRAEDDSGRQRGSVFGVSVSLPLFDRGDREAARWLAERSRVDAERASVEQGIRSEIVRAADTLTLRRLAVADDVEGAADELAQIAEVAYREGEVGILELLDAFRAASRARLRSIDLRLEARLAGIALERAVGDVLWP